jgi:hypothetical protein
LVKFLTPNKKHFCARHHVFCRNSGGHSFRPETRGLIFLCRAELEGQKPKLFTADGAGWTPMGQGFACSHFVLAGQAGMPDPACKWHHS